MVGKVLENKSETFGFNASNETYVDMLEAGIVDPAKVVRAALQDAASVAGLLITTEAMVAELPKDAAPAMPGGGGMGGMGGRASKPIRPVKYGSKSGKPDFDRGMGFSPRPYQAIIKMRKAPAHAGAFFIRRGDCW